VGIGSEQLASKVTATTPAAKDLNIMVLPSKSTIDKVWHIYADIKISKLIEKLSKST
jgi:hypothetical protein